MKITIKDYNGYNSSCETVQKIIKYIEDKKECSISDIFDVFKFEYRDVIRISDYLNRDRKEDYWQWVNTEFSYQKQFEEHQVQLDLLAKKRFDALSEITRIEGLNPARVYSYFKHRQKYITDRAYDNFKNYALSAIIAISEFKEDDYEELQKALRSRYGNHFDAEHHYRIAVQNNNNSAWKSIEKYLKRKPFIVDGKRCYEGFEFSIQRDENYACTGWNDKGNIKFILSTQNQRRGERKLLNFSYEQFKEYFKDKKIID